MAISFPDTVSAAAEFSGGPVRAQGASKSQSPTGIDECGVCSAEKSQDETDDFNAVLGWMMCGTGPQVPPVIVADKSKETSTTPPTISETGSIETATSLDFGQAMAQVRMAALAASSTGSVPVVLPGSSQSAAVISEPAKNQTPIAGVDTESSAAIEMGADTSSTPELFLQGNSSPDEPAAAAQFQSKVVAANSDSVQSFEIQAMEALPYSSVATGPEVRTTAFEMPFSIATDSPGLPEALSQDAIDALERIGLPSRLVLPEVSGSSVSDVKQMTSVLPVSVLPTVPAVVLSESGGEGLEPPVSFSSILPESRLLKAPAQAVIQSTSDLIASSQSLSASVDSRQLAASEIELSVSDSESSAMPAVMDTISESSENDVKSPSIDAASALKLKTNSGSVMSQLDGSIKPQVVESILSPVRFRPSSNAVSPREDKPAFSPIRESRATIASSLDRMPNEISPLSVAESFSNFTASISSEVRQPLSSQVSHAILSHIEHSGVRSNDSLSVRLDPPELGEMRIELSKTVEGLAVRVTASEAVTMDMLLARGQEIESQLRGQQMNFKSLEFLQPGMSGNSFSQGQQNAESRSSEKLSNQIRRGLRNSGPTSPVVGRSATTDSAYGLSFRA